MIIRDRADSPPLEIIGGEFHRSFRSCYLGNWVSRKCARNGEEMSFEIAIRPSKFMSCAFMCNEWVVVGIYEGGEGNTKLKLEINIRILSHRVYIYIYVIIFETLVFSLEIKKIRSIEFLLDFRTKV